MFSRSNSIIEIKSGNTPIGIDFGQKSACVCAIQNSRPKIIPSPDGRKRTPSYFSSWADNSTGNWYHDVGLNAKIASTQPVPWFPLREPIMHQLVFVDQSPKVKTYDVNMNYQPYARPQNIIPVTDMKSLIGRTGDDPQVEECQLRFKVLNEQYSPKIGAEHVRWKDQGNSYFPQQVSADLLQHFKENSAKILQASVTDCVITIPARFNWFQRLAIKDAAIIAGFDVVHLINESSAAAIAYYNDKPPKQPEKVLVIDLGSTSLELSLLIIDGIRIQTKITGGNYSFGGEEFTKTLVEHCLIEFRTRHRLPVGGKFKNMAALHEKCEWVKERLSQLLFHKIRSSWRDEQLLTRIMSIEDLAIFLNSPQHLDLLSKEELISLVVKQAKSILSNNGKLNTLITTKNVPKLLRKKIRAAFLKNPDLLNRIFADVNICNFHQNLDLQVEVSAKNIHDLNYSNVLKTVRYLGEFLTENKIEKNDIDRVILVGASTKFPLLEDSLENFFGDSVPLCSSVNPEFIVAYGAAIQANSMRFIEGNDFPSKKEILEKVTRIFCGFSVPFSIGIQISDPEMKNAKGDFGIVIPRNTQIPCSICKDFLMPVNRLACCDVRIFVGEGNCAVENTLWTSFSLKELPVTKTRRVKIGFTMEVSTEGMLRVSTYCWNNKRILEGTIVDAFHGRAMRSNFIHVLKTEFSSI